jgi:hypothetical protein
MNLEADNILEDYGAGFEGTNALRDKYIKDTPGQRIQQFKTTMKDSKEKLEAEIEEGKFSMRQLYAVVDSTDNTVVGTASSEEAAQRIISSAHLPPISSKNKDKLKVVKTKKVAEVGYPLDEAYSESEMEYLLNKWRETGRIAYRRPNKKLISLNGGPNIPEKQALDKIKDFFDKQSEMEEAYGESWVVYNKDTKSKISKSFKNRKAAYDYAAKNGGVVYSAEYYFDNQDEINSGKLVKEESLDEAMDPQNTSYGYYGTVDVEKYKLIAYKEMADKVLKIARDKKIFVNFPNITSNADQESAVVKYLDSRHGRRIADGNDSPIYIEKDFTKFLKDVAAGHYMESVDLDEAINIRDYMATSEKSQFGGYRPKVVHKDGRLMYLSQASYNTPDEAKDHAEEYLKQYARGISEPRVPVKGTYVKEATEEISLEERRQMKIVALATGSADLDKIYEYVTTQPLKYSSVVELKENFNKYINNA